MIVLFIIIWEKKIWQLTLSQKNKTLIGGLLVRDKMELFELTNLGAHLMTGVEGLLLAKLVVQPVLRENILEAQRKDDKLKEIRKRTGL